MLFEITSDKTTLGGVGLAPLHRVHDVTWKTAGYVGPYAYDDPSDDFDDDFDEDFDEDFDDDFDDEDEDLDEDDDDDEDFDEEEL